MAKIKLTDSINRIAIKCKALFTALSTKLTDFETRTESLEDKTNQITTEGEGSARKTKIDGELKQKQIIGKLEVGKKYEVEVDANGVLSWTEASASGGGGGDGLGEEYAEYAGVNQKPFPTDPMEGDLYISAINLDPSSSASAGNIIYQSHKSSNGQRYPLQFSVPSFLYDDTNKKLKQMTFIRQVSSLGGGFLSIADNGWNYTYTFDLPAVEKVDTSGNQQLISKYILRKG